MTGTGQVKVMSAEPMKVARAIVQEKLKTEGGLPGVMFWREEWWVWDSARWKRYGREEIRRLVWLCLEDAEVGHVEKSGNVAWEPYKVTPEKVTAVTDAMKAVAWAEFDEAPYWLRSVEGFDPRKVVAFEDVVVEVETGRTHPRGPEFFGRSVVPCKWDPEAKCPVYEEVSKEWSQGEPGWVELRERFYGSGLTGVRFPKMLVEFGDSGSGKGVQARLMKHMKGGSPQFVGSNMEVFSREFGSAVLLNAEFLVVGEGQKMDTGSGRTFATLAKMILGEDDHTINRKHKEHVQGVLLRTAVVIQSNQMLDLPDDNQGLSSKMLWLKFGKSWRGKEDVELLDKLKRETAGIGRRWVEAAGRLLRARPEERWPLPGTSVETLKRYKVEVNKWDAFLEDVFVLVRGAFTGGDTIREERAKWEQRTGLVLKGRDGSRTSDQALLEGLEEKATWGLVRSRRVVRGLNGESLGQQRGMLGLALKRQDKE